MNTKPTTGRKRPFEEEGDFYVGSITQGGRTIRLLCFRDRQTNAVGASPRFSRAEAWRRSRKGLKAGAKGKSA